MVNHWSLVLVIAFAGVACAGEEVVYDPAFELGTVSNGEFRPWVEGEEVVLSTVQSGFSFMPAVRFRGLDGHPEVECMALDLDKDYILSETRTISGAVKYQGWMQLPRIIMQVRLPDEELYDFDELMDYYGDRILMQCTCTDSNGFTETLSSELILAED